MNTALVWALWLIVILAVIAMLIVGYINVRARRLDSRSRPLRSRNPHLVPPGGVFHAAGFLNASTYP